MSLLHPPRPKRPYHLSPAGVRALRANAQKNKPWLKSTGPRTPQGKSITSQNALKHGLFAKDNPTASKAYRALLDHLRR